MSVTMRTTLLLLTLACCLQGFIEGGSLRHTKDTAHHLTNKRGKITHHHTPNHLQKKSEHHSKVHHVTAEKEVTSEAVHDTKRAAKTVDVEKVKRFLARILKSAETAKHLPVHTKKVAEKTKRHLKTVQKKRAASQKGSGVKIDVEKVKKGLADRAATSEMEAKVRKLLEAVISRLNSRGHLKKRQSAGNSTTDSDPSTGGSSTTDPSAGGASATDPSAGGASATDPSTGGNSTADPSAGGASIYPSTGWVSPTEQPIGPSSDGDCCCHVMDTLLEHLFGEGDYDDYEDGDDEEDGDDDHNHNENGHNGYVHPDSGHHGYDGSGHHGYPGSGHHGIN